MSERLHEQLSALLDGELPAGEAELLLARLQRDPALRATLRRYTLAGDVIRVSSLQAAPQMAPVASAGFSARVSAAIEVEAQQQASVLAGLGRVETPVGAARAGTAVPAAVHGRRRAVARRWLRPLGGVAVAASVAGLALMVMPRGPAGTSAPLVAATVSSPALPGMGAQGPGAAVVTGSVVPPAAAAGDVLVAATGNAGAGTPARLEEPVSYTTPLSTGPLGTGSLSTGGQAATFIPAAELASYVVAHSEVSGPLARRNVLTGLAAEPVALAATAVELRKP